MVPEASPSPGCCLRGVLLSLESLVEAFPQMARQMGEIGVLQRICQRCLLSDSSDVSGGESRLKTYDILCFRDRPRNRFQGAPRSAFGVA